MQSVVSGTYWIQELNRYLGDGPVGSMVIESDMAEPSFLKEDFEEAQE